MINFLHNTYFHYYSMRYSMRLLIAAPQIEAAQSSCPVVLVHLHYCGEWPRWMAGECSSELFGLRIDIEVKWAYWGAYWVWRWSGTGDTAAAEECCGTGAWLSLAAGQQRPWHGSQLQLCAQLRYTSKLLQYCKYHQMDLWISMCAFTWCRLIALQTYIPGSCYTQNVSGIIFNNDLVIYFTYFLSCSCYIFYIFLVNDLITRHFTYSIFFF